MWRGEAGNGSTRASASGSNSPHFDANACGSSSREPAEFFEYISFQWIRGGKVRTNSRWLDVFSFTFCENPQNLEHGLMDVSLSYPSSVMSGSRDGKACVKQRSFCKKVSNARFQMRWFFYQKDLSERT